MSIQKAIDMLKGRLGDRQGIAAHPPDSFRLRKKNNARLSSDPFFPWHLSICSLISLIRNRLYYWTNLCTPSPKFIHDCFLSRKYICNGNCAIGICFVYGKYCMYLLLFILLPSPYPTKCPTSRIFYRPETV